LVKMPTKSYIFWIIRAVPSSDLWRNHRSFYKYLPKRQATEVCLFSFLIYGCKLGAFTQPTDFIPA
jgi:hypothetical protein